MRLPNIYILGSGFSKSAGLPLGTELFEQILNGAKKTRIYENILKNDIERFLDYNRYAKGNPINEKDIYLEDFISFLDIEHYLKLAGKDHWSDSGNRSQIAIKNIIANLLHRMPAEVENWELYESFGRSLRPGDIIITFNYDTVVETVLDAIGVRYVFSPDEYRRSRNDLHEIKPILILKLHGSLDWYSITPYKQNLAFSMESQDRFWEHKHPVFSYSHNIRATRAFPYIDDKSSMLSNIYRIDDIRSMQRDIPSVEVSPYIVSPSHSKIVYINEIIDLWFGLNDWGNHCSSLTIIGFSLPEHDEYLRQVIYNMVVNYLDQGNLNVIYTKPLLRFVDKVSNKQDMQKLKKRYPFIDFERSILFRDGFGMEAILSDEILESQEYEP